MFRCFFILMVSVLLGGSPSVFAYSLLTHEQLIDLTWDDSIVPLLLNSYPNLTPQQLMEARAYAYGGCVIQDIGYYPYGHPSFSDLTHYVRSGDFVVNLFRNAHNADELAFAIGALSHYIGDNFGHSLATNIAVPVQFPKLGAQYGPDVSYVQGKHEHVQTEFAFDINEIAHHRVAPLRYLRSFGLGVSTKQLSMATYQTYGIAENFTGSRSGRVNVRGYYFAVRSFIPRVAYAVTLLHRHHEPPDSDTPEATEMRKEIAETAAANNWAAYRDHAGIGTWSLAALIFILPKIGPLKLAAVKGPTPDTEAEYMHSLYVSVSELRRVLARFTPPKARRARQKTVSSSTNQQLIPHESGGDPYHPLPNRDLDTAKIARPGSYPLTDSTYAGLLHKLTRQPQVPIPFGIKEDIQAFYANPAAPDGTKKDPARWAQVQADLVTLDTMPTSQRPEVFPTYEEDAHHP